MPCCGGASPTAKSAPHTGKSGYRRTHSAPPSEASDPQPRRGPSTRRPPGARWRRTQSHWPTYPSNPAPESSIRKLVPLPPARGATEPTKCPLCADKFYTSWAMPEQIAWHPVQAATPAEDKEGASHMLQGRARRSPWHAPYAQRPPLPRRPTTWRLERGRGGGRRGPGGWRCSPPGVHSRGTGPPVRRPGGGPPTSQCPGTPRGPGGPSRSCGDAGEGQLTPGGRGG